MCGRFVLFTTGESLLDAVARAVQEPGLAVRAPQGTPGPRYNIAPTQVIPLVRLAADRSEILLEPARWGLIPRWKKDDSGPPLFNARAETVAQKPSFRDAYASGRCILPLDGYYEWHEKRPHFVRPATGDMLWAAGLWASGQNRLSTTMITTAAVEPLSWLHHRLPRFLSNAEIVPWLAGSGELLHPSSTELLNGLEVTEADPAVGNVRNDCPELIG
ncbi:SOS response-associated peptidase [Corynebacterium sp. H128]|uniref:SOS response-associated peptidase n=1 Tax=Corynebacterium sp. H128 TaxID=3133427 RepID=UPI0030AC5B53